MGGIFGSKYVTVVDSVVYNLAGDPVDRPKYFQTAVIGGMLKGDKKKSLGDGLVESLMRGPSMQQRQLYRWARTSYALGTPDVEVSRNLSLESIDVEAEIPVDVGYTAELVNAVSEAANYFFWAKQWILENAPAEVDNNWTADYEIDENKLTITFEDESGAVIWDIDYDRNAQYIYAEYDLIEDANPTNTVRRIWIYKIGSGNAVLDAGTSSLVPLPEFYPFIPLRLDNVPIDDAVYEEVFKDVKKAYRRATGGAKIEKLLAQIEDNESVDDIDFAYLVYGVPLNTSDPEGKLYIYEFLKSMMAYQEWTETDYQTWYASRVSDPETPGSYPYAEHPSVTTLRLKSPSTEIQSYDMRLSWISIDETTGSGIGSPGLVAKDIVFLKQAEKVEYFNTGELHYVRNLDIIHQIDEDSWRKLTIRGMVHRNYVYGGKYVSIHVDEALNDPEESGFIIPMHDPVVKRMNLVLSTQMAVSNALIVFNCYKVVKVRWYERGVFKIVLFVVVGIAMAFAFPAAAGLLGTAVEVGTALGFTSTTAVIVGATVNALAGMLLTLAIDEVSAEVFGDELGSIISVIASFAVMNSVAAYQNTGSWAVNWGEIMKMDNLMKLTDVVVGGYQKYAQVEIGNIQGEITEGQTDYERELKKIQEKTLALLGYGSVAIDPLQFTEVQDSSTRIAESSSTFLYRTTMTGGDLIDLSFRMIEDFASLSLELPTSID